jgi:RHS repeat-associated protein
MKPYLNSTRTGVRHGRLWDKSRRARRASASASPRVLETDHHERAKSAGNEKSAALIPARAATKAMPQSPPDGLITWVSEPETGAPMVKLAGERALSVVCDHLGTPTLMLDEAGRRVWQAELSTWGELRVALGEAADCPHRFLGQVEDRETGLYYNRHRYYDPAAGQYLCVDPIRLAGGLNSFAYVGDPLTELDPLGLAKRTSSPCAPLVVEESSRRRALGRAQHHAQVPRVSKGGENIPFGDLGKESRGRNFNELQEKGGTNLGRRDPMTGAHVFDHPDGHPHQIGSKFPDHHARPHVHGVSANGEEIIVVY